MNISRVPLLVQFPVSGPVLWAGGDSRLQCSWSWWWWSGHTGSSWTQHCQLEMLHLCAASKKQRRAGRGKET